MASVIQTIAGERINVPPVMWPSTLFSIMTQNTSLGKVSIWVLKFNKWTFFKINFFFREKTGNEPLSWRYFAM